MMPPLRLRELNPEEQRVIHTLVRSRTASIRLVERAKIIEQASQGKLPARSTSRKRRWKRFEQQGLAGLEDAARSGAPSRYTPENKAQVLAAALTRPSDLNLEFTCWTFERLAVYVRERLGIEMKKTRIFEILQEVGLRWCQQKTWFDPVLGTGTRTGGGDDLDAFFRVVMRGYQVVYEPASLLYHLHRRDYPRWREQLYYYGVGLTAYLTKCLLNNPRLIFDFLGKFLCGLFSLLQLRLLKQKGKKVYRPSCYPKELVLTEWKGRLYGPFAYIQSRRETRKLSSKLTWKETSAVTPVRGNN